MNGRVSLFGAAVAVAAALGACGGGGVSKAEFVEKADKACGPGNVTVSGLAKPSNLPDLANAAGTLATTIDAQVVELRKLDAPSKDKPTVSAIVNGMGDSATAARTLQESAGKTDDAATARAITDLKAKVDGAAGQAAGYGLTVCARGLQAPTGTVFEGGKGVIKAAFIAKSDALCTAANRRVAALAEPTSLTTAARYLSQYLPIEEKLFADIKALVVPPGDEATVAEMLAAQDLVIAKDKELQTAAQARNQREFDRLDEQEASLVTSANAKFDAYGLKNCGTLSAF